ncbi:hypothetical protein [Blastococcus sp. TF02A-30]|uniref:hypothetical protein n=1 Tax=Blastococcus sp. TF02A-30 TaxID=2250580 RepID=UPI000DE88744|nr:hypothetical protein [Blastococcus sp. TF02A-30]RBY92865.1 hypothetical protein DQ241_02135 [Blastococcus sp. TF02A-30]
MITGFHRTAPGQNRIMTMPDANNAGSEREAQPLGAEKAPGEDRESLGAVEGPADGIAGPAYPPADTEPDAR